MKYPIVCLVGRTNVGKSALFNKLSNQKVKSLVFDKEHVTRDYIESEVTFRNTPFKLVDTGGIFFQKNTDKLTELAKDRAILMMEQAEIILFVCDAKVGIIEQDLQILKLIRKFSGQVILVVNKTDNLQNKLEGSEFYQLGIDNIFYTSAVHGQGLTELLEFIAAKTYDKNRAEIIEKSQKNSAESNETEDVLFKVAIVGKPNVGKSSLLNLLSQKDRSLVSEIEGTTREAIKVNVGFNHQLIELVDTPGIRRQSSVTESLEQLMVKSALASIRTSDLVILMVDGSKAKFCNQELKLLNYALETRKAVLVIINKTDLMNEFEKTGFAMDLAEYDFMFKKVPLLRISCLDKVGIGKIKTALEELWQKCQTKFDTDILTTQIKEYLIRKPLYKQRQLLKIFKVRAIKAKVPTFHLYVNQPKLFSKSELNFVENILRKKYDLRGCPVVLHSVSIS